MRGWLAVAAISIAVLGASARTAAGRTIPQDDRSVVISGSLAYVWHGDPARGCAAARVCDVSGAIIATPDSNSDLLLTRGRPAELSFGSGAINVRVQRTSADGTVSACTESLDDQADPSILFAQRGAGGASASITPLPMSHCATPLIDDLARLRLTARYAASHPATLNLRGHLAFVSGPYSGALTSTLSTRPDESGLGGSSSSESGPWSSPPTHRQRFEYVSMRYRATFAGGGPVVSFSGGSGGVCVLFDSCRLEGTTTVSIPATSFTFRVTGSRPVGRSGTPGRARVLADLAAGRLTIEEPLYVTRKLRGTVTAQTTRNGSPDCNSARRGIPLLLGVDGFSRTSFRSALDFFVDDASQTSVALRAYCAGPTTADVFDLRGSSDLLTGSLSLKDLAPSQSAVTVARVSRFRAPPYTGRWGGQAMIILKRIGLRTGTRWEQIG